MELEFHGSEDLGSLSQPCVSVQVGVWAVPGAERTRKVGSTWRLHGCQG